jgi:hypothetical protein
MARRSIRDLIRRKSHGRKAMSSGMRDLIDSFDAHKPAVRLANDVADRDPDVALEASDGSDRPSDAAHSGTHA